MRILQLGPIPPPVGGLTRNMMAIKDELVARRSSCVFIATSKSSEIIKDNSIYRPASPFELIKLLRSLEYDILHLHIGGTVPMRVLGLILTCAVFGRGKKVMSFHSGGFTETKAAQTARTFSIRGAIFRLYDRIITVNPLLVKVFQNYGVRPEKIKLILPFVLEMPDPSVVLNEELVKFIERSQPFLLSVGGLETDYDNETLIKVMQRLTDDIPDARLMIVGSGSLESKLRQQIEDAGLSDKILLTGNVDHKFVLHLIAKCDILLRTTLFDGDAISVREGLFLGKTVIATDNGMRPKGTVLVAKGDVDGIANAIRSANYSQEYIVPEPNKENIEQVISLYENLLR